MRATLTTTKNVQWTNKYSPDRALQSHGALLSVPCDSLQPGFFSPSLGLFSVLAYPFLLL
jgi:hypothetical protein